MSSRRVRALFEGSAPHVVGDGFPVQTFIPQPGLDDEINPFLLLDYAGPKEFSPTERPRGVDEHPHRGFETVTIVFQGELEHRDSAGHSGALGPGDVQWMTAASGLVHEEKHARAFAARGGILEVVQLWVNLPRDHKMSPPRYQDIRSSDIPVVPVAEGRGSVRVIAGALGASSGPARTFTPVTLYHLRLEEGAALALPLTEGFNTSILVMSGHLTIAGQSVAPRQMALLTTGGDAVDIEAPEAATAVVMSGQAIDEPVARYGPFVMNTREELIQAVDDYRSGRMGHIS